MSGVRPVADDSVIRQGRQGAQGPRGRPYPNRNRERSRALAASISRSRAGACVCSEVSRRRAVSDTSATARSNAASLACDGLLKPESLRTNCSAEAWISSSVAGGSKLNRVLMLRHMMLSSAYSPLRGAAHGRCPGTIGLRKILHRMPISVIEWVAGGSNPERSPDQQREFQHVPCHLQDRSA